MTDLSIPDRVWGFEHRALRVASAVTYPYHHPEYIGQLLKFLFACASVPSRGPPCGLL